MTLIEVMVSALLVALIAIGTLTGLTAANKYSGNERAHAQAAIIAQQNEERVRGEYIETLLQSGNSTDKVSEGGLCVEQASPTTWRYISKAALKESTSCEKSSLAEASAGTSYLGTVFTVTSTGEFYTPSTGASGGTLACESEGVSTEVIKTTSSVTWTANKGKEVTQSSLVKLPSTYAVLVKVENRSKEPVPGATVSVKTAAGVLLAPEQVTPSSGCLVVGDLKQNDVDVDAAKANWVDVNGKSPPAIQEKTLSKTSLTTAEFTIEAAGAIVAEFETNGKAVNSFTFEALHPEGGMSRPEDLVGPENVAGEATAAPKAELPHLFPFKEAPYRVFAGSCEKNNPSTVAGVEPRSAQVEPNTTTYVKVEAPEVNVTVYEGESSKPGSPLAKSYSAAVINTGCQTEKAKAQNYSAVPDEYKAEISGGALVQKYLPYAAELELCVVGDLSGTYYQHKFKLTNTKKSGTTLSFYLKESGYTKSSSSLVC